MSQPRPQVTSAPTSFSRALHRALHAWGGIVESLPVGLYSCDRDGVLMHYNRRAAELWGRTPLLGDPQARFGLYKAFEPNGTALTTERWAMRELLWTALPVRDREVVLERPGGTRVTVLAHVDPLFDAEGTLIGGVSCFQDITELKHTQARLSARERWCSQYNEAVVALAGRPPELGADRWCASARLFHPDGRPMPHEGCPMAPALKENRPVRDGESVAERQAAKLERQRLLAELHRLNETLEQRVEERTRAHIAEIEERRAVEAQLHQLQKTEAIGQLTGGVAHDFNNLLTAVMGNLECIIAKSDAGIIRKHAEAALRAARRGANLTQQLLAFSRRQRLELKATDINGLVRTSSEMLLPTLGGTVQVELSLARTLWPALIDANQIETALLNLAINSRDAMPMGGTVTIKTANLRVEQANQIAGIALGDYVVIAVADTGVGMTEAVREKAFDPFFTTKDVGKGTGLGLSQVYGVVRQSGGAAEIQSAAGGGTTVRIYLPRAREETSAQQADVSDGPATAARGERILVVDDDKDVRDSLVACLRGLDYSVAIAASGAAAIAALEKAPFDLVILDFAMPEMNGVETGRAIAARWLELPVLHITGYADPPALRAGLGDRFVLKKPFLSADLDAKIRAILDRAAPARVKNVVPLRTQHG
jgi:signal transduction histidine kinase/CheY-like chemotaxis protein